MSKHLRILLQAFVLMSVLCGPVSAQQRPQNRPDPDGWRERMRTEKIAFLTSEVGLTPAEAEKFWPVYNQIEQAQHKNIAEVGKSFFELQQAIEKGASEKDIEAKLKAYAKAQEAQSHLEGVQIEKYSKILSMEKIAKLYLAEEKFRRQQITRLGPPKPQPQAHR